MAVVKTLTANGSKGHHKFSLRVSEDTTSGNSSFLSYSFTIAPIQTGWDWYSFGSQISYSVVINGTTYSGTIPSYNGSSTVTLKSNSNIEIPHNSDGTKTINLSFSVADSTGQNYTCGNASASGTMTLTDLHKAPTINTATMVETNQAMITLGLPDTTIVPWLSQKTITLDATPYDSATLSYRIRHGRSSYALPSSSTFQASNVFNTDYRTNLVVVDNGKVPIVQVVADSKGGESSDLVMVDIGGTVQQPNGIPYTKPTLERTSTTIKRKSGGGTNLTDNKANINVKGLIYKGVDIIGNNNSVHSVGYKIWLSNASEPANYTTLTSSTDSSGNVTVTDFEISNVDFTKVYNYKIILQDNYKGSDNEYYADIVEGTVPTGEPTWSEYKDHVDFLAITVGQNPVVASGNNANGYYVKYYDGTMECWNTSIGVSANSNNATWTYPEEFYSTTGLAITITPLYTSGQGSSADAINCISTITKSSVSFYNRVNGATPTYARNVQIRAIGKWK